MNREQALTDDPSPETEEARAETNPLQQQVEQIMAKEVSVMRRHRRLETYFTNDGNLVSVEDARALADALERALPDVPDHDTMEHKTVPDERRPGVRLIRPGVDINPLEWFSGTAKERLKDFIWFCRQGEFDIT